MSTCPPRYRWRLPCTPAHKSCGREKREIGASLVGTPPPSLYASSCLKALYREDCSCVTPPLLSSPPRKFSHVRLDEAPHHPSVVYTQVRGEAAAARDCARRRGPFEIATSQECEMSERIMHFNVRRSFIPHAPLQKLSLHPIGVFLR